MAEVIRAQRPFWMHQLVEYLIGLVLIAVAAQSLRPAVPAVMGALILLNAAVAIGPAGAFRLVPRRVHRILDLVVIALLVVAGIQPVADVENTNRLAIFGIALVMFFVWFHTDFTTREERKARRARQARPESEEIGRQAGRVVGGGLNAVKQGWKSVTGDDDADESGSRRS